MYNPNQQPYGSYSPQYGNQQNSFSENSPDGLKKKKLKQTKIGLGLLLGAVGCQIVALLAAPITCIAGLLGLGVFGLGLSAYIMLLLGSKAIERPHKTLLISSMVIIGIAFLIMMAIAGVAIIGTLDSIAGTTSQDFTGQEIRDIFEITRSMAFIAIVPNIMMSFAYAMILFKPAKKWGRTMLGVFLGIAVLSSIGAAFTTYNLTGDLIDEIDPDRDDYDTEDFTSFQQDATMNGWLAGLLHVPEYIIYLIVGFGAFFNVKKMEEEYQPKLDNRLYDLQL